MPARPNRRSSDPFVSMLCKYLWRGYVGAGAHLQAVTVRWVQHVYQTVENRRKQRVHLRLQVACQRRHEAKQRAERQGAGNTDAGQQEVEHGIFVEQEQRQGLDHRRERLRR